MVLIVANKESNSEIEITIFLIKLKRIWKNYKIKTYGLGKTNF
jgi:hypothetical protein